MLYMCNICIIPTISYIQKKRNSRFIVSLSYKYCLMQFVVTADQHASEVGFILAVDLSVAIILHKLHTGVTATRQLQLVSTFASPFSFSAVEETEVEWKRRLTAKKKKKTRLQITTFVQLFIATVLRQCRGTLFSAKIRKLSANQSERHVHLLHRSCCNT